MPKFKGFFKSNKKLNPIKIKRNKIIRGTPIAFQQKEGTSINLNYPFKIYFYFSYSLKLILS